jgi:hypothetical protein
VYVDAGRYNEPCDAAAHYIEADQRRSGEQSARIVEDVGCRFRRVFNQENLRKLEVCRLARRIETDGRLGRFYRSRDVIQTIVSPGLKQVTSRTA